MAKTLVEKLSSPDLDVTIFKISGTLGFHENPVLTKFFNECSERGVRKLVMDFSELGSLGGGCAKIIRDTAASGVVRICIAGASKTVRAFLERKGPTSITFAADTTAALAEMNSNAARPAPVPDADAEPPLPLESSAPPRAEPPPSNTHPQTGEHPATVRPETDTGQTEDIIADIEEVIRRPDGERRADDPSRSGRAEERGRTDHPSPMPSGQPGGRARPSSEGWPDDRERRGGSTACDSRTGMDTRAQHDSGLDPSDRIKTLKRTLVQYRWLFSLNEDFSKIEDKHQLLDAFLLTTIAQVGVEAGAFLELSDDEFVAMCWKGFETADPSSLNIAREDVDTEQWLQSPRIFPLEKAPLADAVRQRLDSWDLPHAAPFVVHNRFRGIVLLGRPIRHELDDQAWEFLNMMITQVAIAYENSCRLEKETERTLGLVQSLISMVECNTLSRGTTELVMDLTYAVAVRMHYPEEHIRDLMYGTVLRDIGMIKTSDLILRSPRELMQEEWEVIKKHPSEGADMLERMRFSRHTCDIVKYHHERYNGEGYPSGLASSEIPLGARILSVVESYAAMLQDRPTRPALSQEEALATLKENWGLRYDPDVVDVFIDVIEEEVRTGERPRYKGIDLIRN